MISQRLLLTAAITTIIAAMSLPALADKQFSGKKNATERLENAEQRIQYLEQRMQDQNKTIASKQTKGDNWSDALSFSGAIEVETGLSDPENAKSTSDTTVATVELAAEAAISDQLSANIVLLYEEDD